MLKRTSVASVRFKALFPILAALLLAALVLYASVIEPSRLQVKSVSYSSSRLPAAFDGFRVVQLSDLHLGSFVKHPHTISRLVQKVNALHPQLILFTGDLVNRQSAELQPFTAQLSQIKATYGVYAVLGNHDYGSYYRWPTPEAERANLEQLKQMVSDMGWRWLHNAHTFIHHRGDSIALLGVENEGEPPFPQNGDLPAALRGAGNGFKLLMSHNPTHWRREVLPQSDVDLTLSGHTHAMQSVLFGHSLSQLNYPEWKGFYYEGQRALYVNIGIGYVGFPFRFNAVPEITLMTLKSVN